MPFGCVQSKKIQGIEIRINSFYTEYDVDEKLDFTNAYITVKYDIGGTENVAITENMVSGFDSRTTGERFFVVKYKSYETEKFSYTVKNESNYNKEIKTTARIKLARAYNELGDSVAVNYILGDIEVINSVFFNIESTDNSGLGIDDFYTNLNFILPSEKWEVEFRKVNSTSMRILLFSRENVSISSNMEILKININGVNSGKSYKLTNVVIANNLESYDLPSCNI